jgi:hypothetical protein
MQVPTVPTSQAWPERIPLMTRAIQIFKGPTKALEIGTWFGEGSTQIWLANLPVGSTLTLVDSWRPYASSEDRGESGWDYAATDSLVLEAYLSTVLAVRRFENQNRGKLEIQVIRGNSEAVCKDFRDGIFDFIYIDGDHKYSSVATNIRDAKRLAKNSFSLICGDDLEKMPAADLLKVARENLTRDYLRHPHGFHPGVMVAVHEEFGEVNMINGFWWVFKKDGKFVLG